ncbi:uncharacterized protein LOC113323215 [Papaver somniferum]|uniref:uncharacterized protein LOC113323215 n=1 Tax=Papaver somniferum TaxID=3469 RepID=UPI000E6F69A8|nr:uncharacterized protein LOC113323215 [Papaver somniferum]
MEEPSQDAHTPQTGVGSSNIPSQSIARAQSTPGVGAQYISPNEVTIIAYDGNKEKSKVTSEVWLQFTRVSEEKAKYHHYLRTFAANTRRNGTSGLWGHLDRCRRNPNKKKKGQKSLLFPPPKPVHYVDQNWKLQKRIILFCQVKGHTGTAIGKMWRSAC